MTLQKFRRNTNVYAEFRNRNKNTYKKTCTVFSHPPYLQKKERNTLSATTLPGDYYVLKTAKMEHSVIDHSAKLAAVALHLAKESKGFSINKNGVTPNTGFMVSLPKCEEVVPENWLFVHEVLTLYFAHNWQKLGTEKHYFGGWLDEKTGKWYLDISVNIQNKEVAMETAKEFNQLAIFDLSTFESIYL